MENLSAEKKMFAAYVLIITPEGILLIKERAEPSVWKLPGGKGRGQLGHPFSSEDVEHTAIMKVREKTGFCLQQCALRLFLKRNRGTHDFFLFTVQTPHTPTLFDRGKKVWEIRFFSPQEIREMRNTVRPAHFTLITQVLTSMNTATM